MCKREISDKGISRVCPEKFRGEIKEINLNVEKIFPLSQEYLNLRDFLIKNRKYNHEIFDYAKQFVEADANGIAIKSPLLFHAIRHKNSKAARILLKYGADPNLAEEGKVTPLMIAAYYGQIKTIKDLLKYKANLFARNAHGEQANAYVCSGLGTTHKAKTVLRFLSQYGLEQKG